MSFINAVLDDFFIFAPSRRPVQRLTSLRSTILTRAYKGQTLQVQVLAQGFEFEGRFYDSLSAVARAISGSHCSGYWFFGLGEKGRSR